MGAVEAGFLDRTVASDQLESTTLEIAQGLGALDRHAHAATKLRTREQAVLAIQEGLETLPNWSYLTGSLSQLHSVWDNYGVQTEVTPAGAMIAHSDIVYVIDARGQTRAILDSDPGDGSTAGQSSFAALLTEQVQRVTRS